MRRGRRAAAAAVAAVAAAPVGAQVLASEHAVVAQTIDGATITVEYYRPVARGRTIFGKVVPWNETWTPGANWATTLTTDRDLSVEGRPLAKGKYSLWLRAAKDSNWALLFSRTARRFHTDRPDSADIVLRVPVRPERAPAPAEVLTWSFPDVRRDTTTLRMQWTTAGVSVQLAVAPPAVVALSRAVAARYIGTYRIRWEGDTVAYRFDVRTGPRGLTAVFDTLALAPDEDPHTDLLPLPNRPTVFAQGDYQRGQFVGVEPNVEWRFTVVNGRATAVETYSLADRAVHARGVRVADEKR